MLFHNIHLFFDRIINATKSDVACSVYKTIPTVML